MTCDIDIILKEIETHIEKAKRSRAAFQKNFGSDSRQVREATEEEIYYREWWIMFVQYAKKGVFPHVRPVPWQVFKESEAYLPWSRLIRERI